MTDPSDKYCGKAKLNHHMARRFKIHYGTYDISEGLRREELRLNYEINK